jgi:hypothetical protein
MNYDPTEQQHGVGPRIPPPPSRLPRNRAFGARWAIWAGALALGVTLGIVAYGFIPGVDYYFDYWVALLA